MVLFIVLLFLKFYITYSFEKSHSSFKTFFKCFLFIVTFPAWAVAQQDIPMLLSLFFHLVLLLKLESVYS